MTTTGSFYLLGPSPNLHGLSHLKLRAFWLKCSQQLSPFWLGSETSFFEVGPSDKLGLEMVDLETD